jgi:hypothetical protein
VHWGFQEEAASEIDERS